MVVAVMRFENYLLRKDSKVSDSLNPRHRDPFLIEAELHSPTRPGMWSCLIEMPRLELLREIRNKRIMKTRNVKVTPFIANNITFFLICTVRIA